MAAWYGIDPRRTAPARTGDDPAKDWAQYALDAPLLCVRRDDDRWDAPPGLTFAGWVTGSAAIGRPPTVADLDYHLNTLFPPVRPRGYLEVRYLDTQPGEEWIAPVAMITALMAGDATVAEAREIAAPAAGSWTVAARDGLRDPVVRTAAAGLAELACRNFDRTGLAESVRDLVFAGVTRRLRTKTSVEGTAR
jgi:glutamate--cysteine ligase